MILPTYLGTIRQSNGFLITKTWIVKKKNDMVHRVFWLTICWLLGLFSNFYLVNNPIYQHNFNEKSPKFRLWKRFKSLLGINATFLGIFGCIPKLIPKIQTEIFFWCECVYRKILQIRPELPDWSLIGKSLQYQNQEYAYFYQDHLGHQ